MITWQSFGRISVPSTSPLGLIPSGKRVDAEAVTVNLYCSHMYVSRSLFFLHFSLLLLSRFSFCLFTFFPFTSFSLPYILILSPALFSSLARSYFHSIFIALSLSLNRTPHRWTTLAHTSCISLLSPDAPLALAL